jgi:hypothetical protein
VFPNFRLLREHCVCIWSSSIAARSKILCAWQIVRRFSERWKDLVLEIAAASRDGLKMLPSLLTAHRQQAERCATPERREDRANAG